MQLDSKVEDEKLLQKENGLKCKLKSCSGQHKMQVEGLGSRYMLEQPVSCIKALLQRLGWWTAGP